MTEERRKPYSDAELRNKKCFKCGKRARFQWNACADNNVWRPVCSGCDVQLNILVLQFLDPVGWLEKVKRYCYRIRFNLSKITEEQKS